MIDTHGLSAGYNGRLVLREVEVTVPARSWIGLIGPNGAGKTTLLRAVAGLIPFAGEVRIDGRLLGSLSRRRLSQLVAFLPQRPVIPEGAVVVDYVMLGRTPYIPYLGMESRRDRLVVGAVLERLELVDLANRPIWTLSGGETQRVVLARALAQEARVLLLDEPTSALDVGHQQQVLELIDQLRLEKGLTVLGALHDLTLAGQFADRLVLLDGGEVVADGRAEDVLTEKLIAAHFKATVRVEHGPELTVIPVRSSSVEAR